MVFVPVVPSQPPTLEAQEIAREIEDVIVRYQDEHPRTSQTDIQQALHLAQSRAGKGSAAVPAVIAAGLGVAMMIGLLVFLVVGGSGGEIPWIAISSIGILLIAIVPLLFLMKRD